jgi:hypothetical protein
MNAPTKIKYKAVSLVAYFYRQTALSFAQAEQFVDVIGGQKYLPTLLLLAFVIIKRIPLFDAVCHVTFSPRRYSG